MDMKQFRKAKFLKVADVRDRPRHERIAGVVMGEFGKPDLIFESGDRLGLSATNNETLADAYGWESNDWRGHVVELSVGQSRAASR